MQPVSSEEVVPHGATLVEHSPAHVNECHAVLSAAVGFKHLIRVIERWPVSPTRWTRFHRDVINPSIGQRGVDHLYELLEISENRVRRFGPRPRYIVFSRVENDGPWSVWDYDARGILVDVRDMRSPESTVNRIERLHVLRESAQK